MQSFIAYVTSDDLNIWTVALSLVLLGSLLLAYLIFNKVAKDWRIATAACGLLLIGSTSPTWWRLGTSVSLALVFLMGSSALIQQIQLVPTSDKKDKLKYIALAAFLYIAAGLTKESFGLTFPFLIAVPLLSKGADTRNQPLIVTLLISGIALMACYALVQSNAHGYSSGYGNGSFKLDVLTRNAINAYTMLPFLVYAVTRKRLDCICKKEFMHYYAPIRQVQSCS